MGPHPAHLRMPVAIATIAALAYDSAPYRNRPQLCKSLPDCDGFSRGGGAAAGIHR